MRKQRALAIFAAFMMALTLVGVQPGSTLARQADCQTFPETGKTVCGTFLAYWKAHGGLPQQGFPISGEFKEVSATDGKTYTVQYFERAVFEYHPENAAPYDVLLSLLGVRAYRVKHPNDEVMPNDLNKQKGPLPQYSQQAKDLFTQYWKDHGGLAQQGLPLSDVIMEESPLNGKLYAVQYFERAVFEYHPENQAPYNVLLSLLGTMQFKQTYPGGEPVSNALTAGIWGGDHLSFNVSGQGVKVEFDCAHGSISGPVAVDASGHFDVMGVFVLEHGGPTRVGEKEDSHPARYVGTLKGNTLVLTIDITDQNRSIGPYTVILGQQPRIVKCL